MDLENLEHELKKRLAYPASRWHRRQENGWDTATDFIYQTPEWEALLARTRGAEDELRDYAVNRWFNYWSAKGVEWIFRGLPGVVPNVNEYDRLVDFCLNGIPFDHKTSVYPQSYHYPLEFACTHPDHLALWLYQNQSTGRRHALNNRMFVVLYDKRGEHWKLRACLSSIRFYVEDYIFKFGPDSLINLGLNGNRVVAGIVFVVGEVDEGKEMCGWAYSQ